MSKSNIQFVDFNAFLEAVVAILPFAEIGEDNDAQLVIYTGLRETNLGIHAFEHDDDV